MAGRALTEADWELIEELLAIAGVVFLLEDLYTGDVRVDERGLVELIAIAVGLRKKLARVRGLFSSAWSAVRQNMRRDGDGDGGAGGGGGILNV